MSRFCQNCGAPLEGEFCGKCGAKAGAAGQAPQQHPVNAPGQAQGYAPGPAQGYAQAGGPPKGMSKGVKIVLAVVCVLGLFVVLAGVGMYWAASKVKEKVVQVAAEKGLDLKQLAEGSSSGTSVGGDGCWLLPREEAERLSGFRIVRAAPKQDADGSKLTCQYFADPAEVQKAAEAQSSGSMAALKQSTGSNQSKDMQELENLTKSMIAAGAAAQGAGERPLIELSVRRGGGKADWAGVSMASKAMGSLETIPGLGDQAMMAPLATGIFALKGDSFMELGIAGLPGGRQKGLEIARAVLGRL